MMGGLGCKEVTCFVLTRVAVWGQSGMAMVFVGYFEMVGSGCAGIGKGSRCNPGLHDG